MPSMIGLFSAKADLNENGLLQKMGLYAGESDIRYRFQSEGIDIAILSNIKWPAEDPYACNSSQKVEIVLFGECYNTNIERDQIYRSAGVEVKKNTDAELVLAAFLSRDKDNLARLNGQYYAVISEKKSGNFFVLMDRYGVSRLYYTFVPDGLAISGKVRSFLAMPDFVTEPNIEGFHSQLKFGFLMAQESMLKNVNLFPNATLTEYSDGKLKFHKYWDVPQQVDPSNFLNEEESVEELSILMRNGLKKMRRGDYREGFQLSGGLDSRVILSSTDPEEREFLTLTFGLPECYDIRIAKMITSKLRVDHKVFPLDWDVIENNAHQTIWDSDGEGSILLADTLYFSQVVKADVDLTYTGNVNYLSGRHVFQKDPRINSRDELLNRICGEESHLYSMSDELLAIVLPDFDSIKKKNLRKFIETVTDFTGNPVTDIQRYYLHYFHRSSNTGQKTQASNLFVRFPYLENDLLESGFSKIPNKHYLNEKVYRQIVLRNEPELSSIPLGYTNLPIGASKFNEQFSDYRDRLLYRVNMFKDLFRKEHKPYLKRTETINYNEVFIHSENLRNIYKDLLFSETTRKRGLFLQKGVKEIWERHHTEKGSYLVLLSGIASIELFMRQFIDGDRPI